MNITRYSMHIFLIVVLVGVYPAAVSGSITLDQRQLERQWRDFAEQPVPLRKDLSLPYRQCFSASAARYKLPESLLLAVARGESNFEAKARSEANAYGIMQILWPETARHLGITSLELLLDPCTNIDAGARYLQELRQRYHGDLFKTLAAYNYGPGRIAVESDIVPEGAAWYSGYIMNHLQYIREKNNASEKGFGEKRFTIIRFNRPYRAAAFIANLKPFMEDIRLDWFRRGDGRFDVVLLYDNEQQKHLGKQRLKRYGFNKFP